MKTCAYRDVNSLRVPILVDEEVDDIYSMKHSDGHHRPGDAAMDLILIRRPAQVDDGPGNNAGTAVVKEFQVPVFDSWIEFDLDVRGQLGRYSNTATNTYPKGKVIKPGACILNQPLA